MRRVSQNAFHMLGRCMILLKLACELSVMQVFKELPTLSRLLKA